MAKIKKRTQRGQNTPETEFQSIAGSATEFYRAHQKPFNTVLTVLIIAVVSFLLYSAVSTNSEAKAGKMFEGAYASYAPQSGGTPDYPRALLGFQEIAKQYSGTVNGAVSRFFAGNTLMRMGKTDEAIKEYRSVIDRNSGVKFLAAQAWQRLGYAYLSLGNREESIKAFTKAEEFGGAGVATMELAQIYERGGNSEAAQKKYRELNEQLPATTLAMEAKMKLPPPDMKASPSSSQTATAE